MALFYKGSHWIHSIWLFVLAISLLQQYIINATPIEVPVNKVAKGEGIFSDAYLDNQDLTHGYSQGSQLESEFRNIIVMTEEGYYKPANLDNFYEAMKREVPLDNFKNFQYYAPLFIGSNTEQFTFIFDTGSEWLWVPLDSCINWDTQTKYTPASSFESTGKEHNITYLDSSVSGVIAKDQVRILSTDIPLNMSLVGVNKVENFAGTVSDGILGLTPAATDGADLFLDQLYKQKMIENKTFGLDVNSNPNPSKIIFGGYDQSKVENYTDIVWLNLHNDNNWWVRHSRVYIDDFLLTSKGGLTVFDSGTSITTFQTNIYYAMLQALFEVSDDLCQLQDYEGTMLWHCPCTSPSKFKDIKIDMKGTLFTLSTNDYIIQVDNICVVMIQGANFEGNSDIILLGSNFFFNYYVYHDASKKQIGLYGPHEKALDAGLISKTTPVVLMSLFLLFTNLF